MQTQAETRSKFIKARPGKSRPLMKGMWYKCAHCKKWCGRPGNTHVYIHVSERMEVDHIKPWSMGGSDALWNLQPLCHDCNRSKSSNVTNGKDKLKIAWNNIVHLDLIPSFLRKTVRQSKLLKKLGFCRR